MSKGRRIILMLVVVVAIVFLLKGTLFRFFVSYRDCGTRDSFELTSWELRQYIDSCSVTEPPTDIMGVIMLANKITASQLTFRASSKEIDPNMLCMYHRTHCRGYAAFFEVVCNYLLEKYKFNKEWSCSAHVGHIYLMSLDVHRFFKSSFFKNHDFNSIRNNSDGKEILIDATVYDYFGIETVAHAN
jgi:hypothetical protein